MENIMHHVNFGSMAVLQQYRVIFCMHFGFACFACNYVLK